MNERDLFLSALGFEDPADRQAHLREICGDDAKLLSRVEALLESHESQFLKTPAIEQMADDSETQPEATMLVENGSTLEDESEPECFDSHPADTVLRSRHDREDEIPLGFLQPSAREDSLGRLDHYEILEILGQGAFGTVLKAFDEQLHRVVAIKVMSTEMAATSPARKRFLREAQSSAAVRHENVVNIYNVGEKPIPFLVMEFIPGQTLQQRLKATGPLDVPEVLRLGKQIAYGLAAAHSEQLIHRDVKPGNILLDSSIDDRVKITDFGLARAADDASMTQSGMIAGTPLYMAPEQALGQKLDQRADLFSFGSVLYQMLGGRPPFRAPNSIAVLKRVVEDRPRPLNELIPEIPEWMCHIVARLHEKNPDDRFQSAKEVGELLDVCLTDLQQGRLPQVDAPPSTVKLIEEAQVRPTPLQVVRPSVRSVLKVVAALLILIAGLAITEATGMTKLSQAVVRLVLGSGTLVIETDDPNLTVSVDGEEVTITGAGIKQLTLTPGKHQIAAFKNGEPIKQELVTITRNGEVRLRLSLERSPEIARSRSVRAGNNSPADAPPSAIAPFDAEQAKTHQEAWAKHLGVPVEYENSIGMKFRLIPPGEFLMGSTPEEIDTALQLATDNQTWKQHIQSEGPQHRVILTQPIYVGVTEVTQAQYQHVMGTNPSHFSTTGAAKNAFVGLETSNHPVEMVNWNDAAEFCAKLSRLEQRKPFYFRIGQTTTSLEGTGYRLPTEAEWEFACRAGTTTQFWER